MTIPDEHKGRYFYHFTHLKNVESIFENGLLSTNKKNKLDISHTNIAAQSIQDRRENMAVDCIENSTVHDFVPFYFATTNPMLLGLLHKKNIDQPFIVYFAISIDKLKEDKVVFTDIAANSETPPTFYTDPKDLDNLDWDEIDSRKWKADRAKRMAEVLIHEEVPLDWIESIIVYNESPKKYVEDVCKKYEINSLKIEYQPFASRFFYFTKFFFRDRKNETLITGPTFLRHHVKNVINDVTEKRKTPPENPAFNDIKDALEKIEQNFCIIPELEGIYELETKNDVHEENVSEHTLSVLSKLTEGNNSYYENANQDDKETLRLAAYLHDIGKGPKSKWSDGKQPAYPDHPADGLLMLERILAEDFRHLTQNQTRDICLLVAYHDLIGDILERDRDRGELIQAINNERELNLLLAISLADISAISFHWAENVKEQLPEFIKSIKENIK